MAKGARGVSRLVSIVHQTSPREKNRAHPNVFLQFTCLYLSLQRLCKVRTLKRRKQAGEQASQPSFSVVIFFTKASDSILHYQKFRFQSVQSCWKQQLQRQRQRQRQRQSQRQRQ